MIFENPNLKRENPFRRIYDSEEFKSVLMRKDAAPSFPYLLDVELTNHCNLRCIFCGQQAMTRNKGFMSEEIFKKVINECSKYKTPVRLIRWGEPFLHPKIIDFCRYVKSKGLILHVTTNGLTIKEDDMKSLLELELDSMIFSFQGSTKEQYEIMRNNNRHDELRENVLKMVKIRGDKDKPFIHISSTVANDTKEQIKTFVDYWGHIVDSVGIGNTHLSRLSTHQIKSLETITKLEALKEQETLKKCYKPCMEVYQKLSVDWDGKVTCCNSDFDNFMTVGDLAESSIFDIWNKSKELKVFREILNKNLHRSLSLCSTCYHTYEEF